MATYLTRRAGIFHFRRVVPFELQEFFKRREIWRTLHTTRKREARLAAAQMSADFDKLRFLGEIMGNRDALRRLCDDYRQKYGLDRYEITAEGRQYLEDLARRYAQARLQWIEDNRLSGLAFMDAIFNDPEKTPPLAGTEALSRLKTLRGHFPANRGDTIPEESRTELMQIYKRDIAEFQRQLASSAPTLGVIAQANKVLDFLQDDQVPRHQPLIGGDSGTINPDPLPPLFQAFCLIFLKAEIAVRQKELGSLEGKYTFPIKSDQSSAPEAIQEKKPAKQPIKLNALIDFWLEWYKSQDTANPYTLKEYEQAVRLFGAIVGNKPVDRLTVRDIEDFLTVLRKLPRNANKLKQYRELSPRQQAKQATKLKATYLAPPTIRQKLERVKHLLNWAYKRGYTANDIGAAVEVRKTRKERRTKVSELRDAFTPKDLKAIAEGLKTERSYGSFQRTPSRYWMPLLGLFCGLRAEEAAELLVSDIFQQDAIWCIRLDYMDEHGKPTKRLKTSNAKRIIPIHKALISIGLLEYANTVKAQGKTRLWPELKADSRGRYHRPVTRWFNGYSPPTGFIKKYLDSAKLDKKSFHSLRHNFATALKNAEVPEELAAALLGHAAKTMSYERYGKNTAITVLHRTINRIDFGVNFESVLGKTGHLPE